MVGGEKGVKGGKCVLRFYNGVRGVLGRGWGGTLGLAIWSPRMTVTTCDTCVKAHLIRDITLHLFARNALCGLDKQYKIFTKQHKCT